MIPLGLRATLRLLTVIPVAWDERERDVAPARTLAWFPVVGALIGGALYAALSLPLPPIPRAALCLLVWTAVTGGLHEDGMIDCADAAFAPVGEERRNEIRRDPHVGAHGVTASVLVLLLRFAALTAAVPAAAFIAPIAGRWTMILMLTSLPPHGSSTLGARYARGSAWPATAIAIGLVIVAAALLREPLVVVGAAAGIGAGYAAAVWLTRRLHGASGDVHGAGGIVAETVTLYTLLAL